MGLVDTHCHLQTDRFDEDRDEILARSREALDWLVVIGDTLASSEAGVALCGDGIYAAVGVHPYHPEEVIEAGLTKLRELAARPGVVAIGEIGLDYYKYNDAPPEAQQAAFRAQLELAVELDLPVVIHNRESEDDLSSILDEYHQSLPGGILHCFAGSDAYLERGLGWGFHISFAGNVTFPKAQELRDRAVDVPFDRLLIETDSPYLAPQPVRGKRCEPAYVRHTAETLAEVKGVSYDELVAQTAANAARLFRIPVEKSQAES
jgi:TatD DNase family protein